ncbi:MAG: SUF system Fe-S cluster assembly protein [Kordiimonadaceae bacterium]|jgi:FeS assembly SUF system protein|nr:SUF system Fe-S cluster assembly protein [Kordiimonadaceae bacterium]MBT6035563.1 SUF system Fe-S cluster assembly protein [Kordiimonadaceae bacterium]MBT6330857.1 SUF system Fe-S cluster assembly protein [Kordiimonadaceae bacterium]MBT7581920.1 SUF system Fe-S cluster assembly protein [Kordiimonadaceae bacterium]
MSFLDGFLNERPDQKPEDESKEARQTTSQSGGDPISSDEKQNLQNLAAEKIREIFDPEIPVNIYELGLIYDIDVNEYADVVVTMTLTSPHCPVAESMPGEVEMKVREVSGVGDVQVALVWEPPWDMSMMSEAARLEMGFM